MVIFAHIKAVLTKFFNRQKHQASQHKPSQNYRMTKVFSETKQIILPS